MTWEPKGVTFGRKGMTVVELLFSLLLLATVLRVAIPQMQLRAVMSRASPLAEAIVQVGAAAVRFQAESGAWPPDSAPGEVPTGLMAHLPPGFTFQGDGFDMDWDHWYLPNGVPEQPRPSSLVGISIVMDDPALGTVLQELLEDRFPSISLPGKYMFLLDLRERDDI
ncbi:MAG: hypothetical protein WEA09_02670 [Gemmatimonadota bacterium]